MRVSDDAIEVALPVLERELAARPCAPLADLVERMRTAKRRRELAYHLEREAFLSGRPVAWGMDALAANGNGTLSGPVAPAPDVDRG